MHRRLPIYQIDAFTRRVFGGNPAAVCPLEEWLPDKLLQRAPQGYDHVDRSTRLVRRRWLARLAWHLFLRRGASVDLAGSAAGPGSAEMHVAFALPPSFAVALAGRSPLRTTSQRRPSLCLN